MLKKIIGAFWPFLFLLGAYFFIGQFGITEKDTVLLVPLVAGFLLYLIVYIIALKLKLSIIRSIITALILAILLGAASSWGLFFGFKL